MAEGTISVIVPIHAKDETREAVRLELLALAKHSKQEAGNISFHLHESVDDKNMFIIYETWKDQEALDLHMGKQYLKSFLEKESALLTQPICGTLCKIFTE